MINTIFLCFNLWLQAVNQKLVIDSQTESLSLYQIRNEDQELTVWIRFQILFPHPDVIPFAYLNEFSPEKQLILSYKYRDQLELTFYIPQLNHTERLYQISSLDKESWFYIYLFKENQFTKIQTKNQTLILPQIQVKTNLYEGSFITWQNISFSLKAYIGNQESFQFEQFHTFNDDLIGFCQQPIMNYRYQIELGMYLRQIYNTKSFILLFKDTEFDYKMLYENSSIIINTTTPQIFDTKQIDGIQQMEWFTLRAQFYLDKTIFQINTQRKQQELVFTNRLQGHFGLFIHFNNKFTQFQNIKFSNRLDQNAYDNCFPGCKKCLEYQCFECEVNLKLSNLCSCDLNQFYDKQLQRCQDITKFQGISENPLQSSICQFYEYFDSQQQRCLKCPKIEEYYCTDCVYNTNLWKLNRTCTFQEINTNIFLKQTSSGYNLQRNNYDIKFDQDVTMVLNRKCVLLEEQGQILCENVRVAQKFNAPKGYFSQFEHSVMCELGYTQINLKCLKCPLNCKICIVQFKKIKCVICREGYQIIKETSIIKKCINNLICSIPQQQLNKGTQEKCVFQYDNQCLFCEESYLLDDLFQCVSGEIFSNQFNFEFFANHFQQISFQQLIQLSNQNLGLSNSIQKQIQFFSNQYQYIRAYKEALKSNNDSACNQYIYFNQTKKCSIFENNYQQILNNEKIYYCPNKKCSYNLTLNIDIYYSNTQIIKYGKKSYRSIQELLSSQLVELYFAEIEVVAMVYVFDSYQQSCFITDIFYLREEFVKQFQKLTYFKLVLIFQNFSKFPLCTSKRFFSNFNYVEIRNLETNSSLLIRIQSNVVKFINCKFKNILNIIVYADFILFEKVQILDSVISDKLLIQLVNLNFGIETVQFSNCNFTNLKIIEGGAFIEIGTFAQKIILQDITVFQTELLNSIFFQIDTFEQFETDGLVFQNFVSFRSIIFQTHRLDPYKSFGTVKLQFLKIDDSQFQHSTLYTAHSYSVMQYVEINNCSLLMSEFLVLGNDSYLINFQVRFVFVYTSNFIVVMHQGSNISLESIRIVDSQFNITNINYAIFLINCKHINLQNIMIANSTYQPPTNIFQIKAKIAQIRSIQVYNITPDLQPVDIHIQKSMMSFDILNIQLTQLYFAMIKVNHQKLLNIQSDQVTIIDLQVQNIKFQGVPLTEIIEFSLNGKQSYIKLSKFLIANLDVQWDQKSHLVVIKGNQGKQSISQVVINNVKSYFCFHIFALVRNNLELIHVQGTFQADVGLITQYESNVFVKYYNQNSQGDSLQVWGCEVFQNTSPTSNFESLSITDSLFNNIKQPLVKIKHHKMCKINVQNIQILNYTGTQNIFDLQFQKPYSESIEGNVDIVMNMEKVQIHNTSKGVENIIFCKLVNIKLSQIYLVNTNSIILHQYGGKSTFIKDFQIQNSSYKNFSGFILSDIQNTVQIQDVFIQNQESLGNLIKLTSPKNDDIYISIKNIYIDQCNDCQSFVTLYQTPKEFFMKNIFVQSSNFKSEFIIATYDNEQKLNIFNLIIINSNLKYLVNNQGQRLYWYFDKLFLIDTKFNHQIVSERVSVSNSYILNCSFDGMQITVYQSSLVLDKNQKILEQPLVISFNKNNFLNSMQVEQNIYEILFNNNSKFAYVPVGIPLSQFVYLNQITQEYERPYDDFIIILNQFSYEQILCTLNQSINEQQGNFSNMSQFYLKNGVNIIEDFQFTMNPYVNYTYIQNDIHCNNYTLRFNVRALPCQLGEYLYQNKCVICDITKYQYSVVKKAQMCDIMDIQKIQQLKVGKIMLRPGFWRAKEYSNKIENCDNELCLGGWTPGDTSCSYGHVGALCTECDIYDVRGEGRFAQFDDGCALCEFNQKVILKGVFISLWLMLMGFMSYNTNNQITRQYLFYKIMKRNLADILMRQSTNQVSIIIKIFANYVFYIYLLKDELDFINYQFHIQLDFISNPSLLVKPQLDCLLVQYHQVGVHYLQLAFSIISPFYTLTLLYLVFLILFKLKVIQFQFNLIIITIYSVYLFNQQIIFQQQIQLLSYNTVSNIDWINLNQQFEFNTRQHHHVMYYYIIPSTILFTILPIFIFQFLRNMNRISIKSTKYFGILFTEYKRDYYYWEIVRTYQKYVIIMSIYYFSKNYILYVIQIYFALNIYSKPYPLKNLNHLEQKSLFILISTFLNILFITDDSKIFRVYFFIIFNFILLYDMMNNLIQKLKLQNKDLIFRIQKILIQRYSITMKLFDLKKQAKLQYNIDILRKGYLKSKPTKQIRIVNLEKIQLQENFQRLETEIEMTDVQK